MPIKRLWFFLSLFWILFGIVTHVSSILWKFQYEEPINLDLIIDIGFYFHIPSILWIIYTPFLIRWYNQRPINSIHWKRNLPIHLIFSIVAAPVARIIAISIDYSIKNLVGMTSIPIYQIIPEAKYVIFASSPRAFLFYWIIIGAVILWEYLQDRRRSRVSTPLSNGFVQQILVPYKSGKKILDVEDILWIAASKNYIDIHTAEETYKIREPLGTIGRKLDRRKFFQIHRSKIINKAAVSSLKHWRRGEYLITLKNQRVLTSSRTYLNNIKSLHEVT